MEFWILDFGFCPYGQALLIDFAESWERDVLPPNIFKTDFGLLSYLVSDFRFYKYGCLKV